MKHSIWSTPMPDAAMPELAWRLDPAPLNTISSRMSEALELQSEADAGSIVSGSGPVTRSTSTGSRGTAAAQVARLVVRWSIVSRGGNARFEMAIHQFASAIVDSGRSGHRRGRSAPTGPANGTGEPDRACLRAHPGH